MTELLLPGAGIPAIPEVIQPTRISSAKSGSTDFSGILRRAAESLRQAGATEPAYRTSSLFSGSLPFVADTNSATPTENIVIPVSRTESSLLADDTIRVVADPMAMMGSDVISPDAASIVQESTGNPVAFSDPETGGGEVLQQMQDVLHTLAGLVTTLLGQNQGQNVSAPATPVLPVGKAEESIDIAPNGMTHSTTEVISEVSPAIPVAVDESGENPVSQSKEVLLPVVNTHKSINTTTDNETGTFVLPVMLNGERRPEITVPEAEIPTLSPKVYPENVGSEPMPTGGFGSQQVETEMLPPTPDTVIGTDVQTREKTKTTDTGVVEQRHPDTNTVSDDNTDRLLVFVPSIGLVTIQPEPAEDGALTINVEVPREIPPTPAALRNLLGDITGAVQNLLPNNEKTEGESTIPPTVPNKQMGGGVTLAHQIGETPDNVVLPVSTLQNDSPNKVGIETDGRDGISTIASNVVSTGVPDRPDQVEHIQSAGMVQSQPTSEQASDSSQVVAHTEVKTTGLANNLSISSDTSAVSTNIHSLASTVVAQQTIDNPFAAKITEAEQRLGTWSEPSTQHSGKVQIPMSSPVETVKVPLPSDSSIATSLVEPTVTPENSDNSGTPKQPDVASYPTIKTINLTFTAVPKQKVHIPAIVPDISVNRIPVTSAPVPPLTDTPVVSGDTINDNDSLHEAFTGQNDIPQPEVLDKEAQPIIAITPEVNSTNIVDTPISVGSLSNEGHYKQTALPKSNQDGLQANVPFQFTDESVDHLATQKADHIVSTETGIGDEGKVQQEFVSTVERGAVVSTVRENTASTPNIPTIAEFVQPEVVSNPALASDTPIVSSVSDVDVSMIAEPVHAIPPSTDDAPKVLSSVASNTIAGSDIPVISKPMQPEAVPSPVPIGDTPIVQSEIADSDIPMMNDTEVDVSSAPASVNVGNHPLQAASSDGMQAFFPYIKPEKQPQEHIDLPRPEEPEIVIPVAPEPEQSVLATDDGMVETIPSTEKTGTGVPPAGDISHSGIIPTTVGSQSITADENPNVILADQLGEVETLTPTEKKDTTPTAEEHIKSNTSATTPADRIEATVELDGDAVVSPKNEQTLPVDATMREQHNRIAPTNDPQIEGTTSKSKSVVGAAPFPTQPDTISADHKTSLYDVVEPLPVRLQTNGDMVGLDTLLREAQRNGATVTRLSITMPQQVSEMKTLSPKANSNQLNNTASTNIIMEKADIPFLRPDPEVSEGSGKPINVHLSQNQEVSEPLSSISHGFEPRLPVESNIGTSIEDLSEVWHDVREPVGTLQYRTLPQSEQPVGLFTQQVASETERSDNSLLSTGQPVVATNEVRSRQNPFGSDGVLQEREKISQKKGGDPTPAKNSNYGIPQLQDVEKPILVQTGGRTDVPQAVSGGSGEVYTSTSLPADRIPVPIVPDNVPATGQNEVTEAIASGVYHATVRSGTPVRTTAGRLSAARNAVESLRENTAPITSGTERGEGVISEPVVRTNNESQEHSQTPFRQEYQNQKNDIISVQSERSMSVAGSESYRNVAEHSTESVVSEDARHKNTIRPESIHPGIPLPMMPKIATPVVRTYRNVAHQEIPEIVQTAVRTFPSGSGGTIQMALAPESLGEVLVAISVRDSIAEVRIDTETNESRKIVEAQLPALREKLTQAGLQVEHIEVRTKPQDTVQSDASRSGRQGSQTQEEQKSRQDFVRSFRHLANDEGREQPDVEIKRVNPYRIRGGNFERYA